MVKTTKLNKLQRNPLDIKLKEPKDLLKMLSRIISGFINKKLDEKTYRGLIYGLSTYSQILKDIKPEVANPLQTVEIKFLNSARDIDSGEDAEIED